MHDRCENDVKTSSAVESKSFLKFRIGKGTGSRTGKGFLCSDPRRVKQCVSSSRVSFIKKKGSPVSVEVSHKRDLYLYSEGIRLFYQHPLRTKFTVKGEE